jgi:hypothetical protein
MVVEFQALLLSHEAAVYCQISALVVNTRGPQSNNVASARQRECLDCGALHPLQSPFPIASRISLLAINKFPARATEFPARRAREFGSKHLILLSDLIQESIPDPHFGENSLFSGRLQGITLMRQVRWRLRPPPVFAFFRGVRARLFAFDSRISLANRWPEAPVLTPVKNLRPTPLGQPHPLL